MQQTEELLQLIIERVALLHRELSGTMGRTQNTRLQDLWREWEARLLRIPEESPQRPEVPISLVGSTGAGKSTLLNALLGTRLLPVSNMRACTAAISEVAYAEGPAYTATIEFVSRESWQREIGLLHADITDVTDDTNSSRETLSDVAGELDISHAARDRLWTVYRPSEDANPRSFDVRNLEEPPEITRALDTGVETFSCHDLEEFRKRIAVYLESRHRYWPIVKAVKITGPFAALRSGAKLIDLPGLNDPNEAREEVTKAHLKTCRYVWIVFNIKRVLTRDTVMLLMSDDFLRQVVMDGRAGALTFVGTASDDVDPESGREEFSLGEEASEVEVILARNRAVQQEVTRQLEDLSARLARMAGEKSDRAKTLAELFKRSQIFAVSAREYLRLSGLAKTKASGLETLEQTEIPALQAYMDEICAAYGVDAQLKARQRQIDLLIAEIKQEIYTQQTLLNQRMESSHAQRKEIEKAATAAHTFLETRLAGIQERFAQDLEASQRLLRERLKLAFERANGQVEQIVNRWSRMHWATVRAVSRRNGVYRGSTGQHDFPAELAKPALDTITFAWSDFFEDRLGQALEMWTQRLLQLAEDQGAHLLDAIRPLVSTPVLERDVKNILATTERVLTELVGQTSSDMTQRIEQERRTLYERIPDQIRANMRPAFEKAAAESGTGTRARIVDILSRHARDISAVMFAEAERDLLQGVRSLSDWLGHQYAAMTETVLRHAGLASENLRHGNEELTVTAIEQDRETFQGVIEVINAF